MAQPDKVVWCHLPPAFKMCHHNNDKIFSLIHECFMSITSQIDFSRTLEATHCEFWMVNTKVHHKPPDNLPKICTLYFSNGCRHLAFFGLIRNAVGGEETINLGLMPFPTYTALPRSRKS